MVIFVGSDEHKDFVSKLVSEYETASGPRPGLFYYKKTRFKGFSVGNIKIGEHKITFPNDFIDSLDKDDDIVLVVRGEYGKWNSDAFFTEICQLTDTLKNAGPNMKGKKAKRLCIALPREGYVKQDHIFRDDEGNIIYGESLTSTMQRRIFKNLGADMLLTVYPHDFRLPGEGEGWIRTAADGNDISKMIIDSEEVEKEGNKIIQDWTNFAWAINPVKIVAEHFSENDIKIDVVVAPDRGSYPFSKFIADSMGAECAVIDSHRWRKDTNQITSDGIDYDVSGKSVLIPDDFILAGGKTRHAIDQVRKGNDKSKWPKEIHIAVIHGEMSGTAYESLMKRNVELYCSNSIKNPAEKLDITPILARRIHEKFIQGK